MKINKLTVIPDVLQKVSGPPKELYYAGTELKGVLQRPRVAIVGSRKISSYGKQITTELSSQLARQGIVIVSGLAIGVDSYAHIGALKVQGSTIAVLPGPLETIAPASNYHLARQIVEQGGALLSEYAAGSEVYKTNFVARNRLVAGIADAVLITEATADSGSLHTAKFAKKQGTPVLAVPGAITNSTSEGANGLIKQGAQLITGYEDVLDVLGLKIAAQPTQLPIGDTQEEQLLIELLAQNIQDEELLLFQSDLDASTFSQNLMSLEIHGKIRSLGDSKWALC